MNARAAALEALSRIDDGAYANLGLPGVLERSGLDERDRRFVTDLVYGTTRMRRACDHLLVPHLRREVDPEVRRVLRLGAYQLAFASVPPHAAVSATVAAAPHRARGFVNAVLRRVAEAGEPGWPDLATRLSYPDWLVELLTADLGPADTEATLAWMNRPPEVVERPDGYIQDRASQWVAAFAAARFSGTDGPVLDLCAAPGGKATALATTSGPASAVGPATTSGPAGGSGSAARAGGGVHSGAASGVGSPMVVAADLHPARAALIRANARRVGAGGVLALAADGTQPPFRAGTFGGVLVDAPCSGLGVLRRRPDARWRLDQEAPERLARLQRQLLGVAATLVCPGGCLVYSVCTISSAETIEIDRWAASEHPDWSPPSDPTPPPGTHAWRRHGRGWLLLPQDADTDGMFVLALTAP